MSLDPRRARQRSGQAADHMQRQPALQLSAPPTVPAQQSGAEDTRGQQLRGRPLGGGPPRHTDQQQTHPLVPSLALPKSSGAIQGRGEQQAWSATSSVASADHLGSGPEAAYDLIAAWYVQMVSAGQLPHDVALPALFELLAPFGPLAGKQVLDLACGTGHVSRTLAAAGARVLGVDISRELLRYAVAVERTERHGITYRLDDATVLGRVSEASQDAVVSCLALSDIEDLGAVYRAVARVLRPGGAFVWAIVHPAAPVSGGDGTLLPLPLAYHALGRWRSRNAASVRSRVTTYHRPLSAYLNLALQAGFTLADPAPLCELPAPQRVLVHCPQYLYHPFLLAARLDKPAVVVAGVPPRQ